MCLHSIPSFAIEKNRFNDGRQSPSVVAPHEYSCGAMAGARRRKRRLMISRAMLRLVFVVLCALGANVFCPLAHAQPSPARRAFEGRVSTDNGLPVGGATITLRRSGTTSASFWGTVLYSDARGDFSVPDAEEGEYAIAVEAGGLASMSSFFILSEKTPFLKATLKRLATLSLRVLRPDGTPLASVPISILTHETSGGTAGSMRRETTDASGVVSISQMTPGVVSVRVVAARVGYADLNDLKIAPGSRAAAVDARLQAGATLRIMVRDPAPAARETPAANAAPVANGATKTDADKAASARVLGSVKVMIQLASIGAQRFQNLPLSNAYTINGTLLTRDGEGSTEVSALAPGIYMVSLERRNYGTPAAQTVEIKATETASCAFEMKRVDGVAVGQIALLAQGVKGQALGNRDLLIQAESLAPGGDNVTAVEWRSARTDARGRVVLYPVEAGRWRITPRIAANSDAPATQNTPAAAPQITIVAPLATAPDPAALTFSFTVD